MKDHMEETIKEDRKSAHFCVSREVIEDDLREAEHVIYNSLRSVREKAYERGRREENEACAKIAKQDGGHQLARAMAQSIEGRIRARMEEK